MSTLTDIRREYEATVARAKAISHCWPCATDGVEASRSSGLICAAAVGRAMWSRLKHDYWPDPKLFEAPLQAYMWTDFREDRPGFRDALRATWTNARELAMRQQDGTADDSFAGVCRGVEFVKAFWVNPLFQLTTPHIKAGPDYDKGRVVLEGEDLARQAVVAWDGLKPPTLAAAVNKVTSEEEDSRGNITYKFFRGPALIQVDFTPGRGSGKSLVDIWRFAADRWTFEPEQRGTGKGAYEKTGRKLYTILGVVLHRESENDVDRVRLFRVNGREELPRAQTKATDWPFDLGDVIPVGRKVTVFYNSVPKNDEVPLVIESSVRHPQMPVDLRMQLNAMMRSDKVAQAWDDKVPDRQTSSEGQEEDRVRKWKDIMTEAWANLLPRREDPEPVASQSQHAAGEGGAAPPTTPAARRDVPAAKVPADHARRSNPPPKEPRADRVTVRAPPTEPRADRVARLAPPIEPRADRRPPTDLRSGERDKRRIEGDEEAGYRTRKRHREDDDEMRDIGPKRSKLSQWGASQERAVEEAGPAEASAYRGSSGRRRPDERSPGPHGSQVDRLLSPRDQIDWGQGASQRAARRREKGHRDGRHSSTDSRRR